MNLLLIQDMLLNSDCKIIRLYCSFLRDRKFNKKAYKLLEWSKIIIPTACDMYQRRQIIPLDYKQNSQFYLIVVLNIECTEHTLQIKFFIHEHTYVMISKILYTFTVLIQYMLHFSACKTIQLHYSISRYRNFNIKAQKLFI